MGSQSIPAKSLNLGVLDMVPLLPGNRPEQAVQWAGELVPDVQKRGAIRATGPRSIMIWRG